MSNVDLSGRGSVTVRHGCAHLCPQSSFIHVSREITRICRGFQNTVCACLIANKSSRNCLHIFFITFKPWLSVRVFLDYVWLRGVYDDDAAHKMYQPRKRKMSVFLIVEKTSSKKINCRIKWLPSCQSGEYILPNSTIHSAGIFFPSPLLFTVFFFSHPRLHDLFSAFSPHDFSNGPSLINGVVRGKCEVMYVILVLTELALKRVSMG